MSDASSPGVPSSIAELMVAVGRIEEKLNRIEKLETRIEKLEDRFDSVEKTVVNLDALKPVKTPLWQILGGWAAVMAIVVGAVNISVVQQQRQQTNTELQILRNNQNQIIEKVDP